MNATTETTIANHQGCSSLSECSLKLLGSVIGCCIITALMVTVLCWVNELRTKKQDVENRLKHYKKRFPAARVTVQDPSQNTLIACIKRSKWLFKWDISWKNKENLNVQKVKSNDGKIQKFKNLIMRRNESTTDIEMELLNNIVHAETLDSNQGLQERHNTSPTHHASPEANHIPPVHHASSESYYTPPTHHASPASYYTAPTHHSSPDLNHLPPVHIRSPELYHTPPTYHTSLELDQTFTPIKTSARAHWYHFCLVALWASGIFLLIFLGLLTMCCDCYFLHMVWKLL